MKPQFTDTLTWYQEYKQRAIENNDEAKHQFCMFWRQAESSRNLLELEKVAIDGMELAQQLNEPYWFLLFKLSHTQIVIKNKTESEVIDITTRFFVEANKNEYKGCPLMIEVHHLFIKVHFNYDAGYYPEILDGIDYCLTHLSYTQDNYVDLLHIKMLVYIFLEDWHKAKEVCKAYQIHCQHRLYNLIWCELQLCLISYKLRDIKSLEIHILTTQRYLENYRNNTFRCMFLYWRCVFIGTNRENKDEIMALATEAELLMKSDSMIFSVNTIKPFFYYIIEHKQFSKIDSFYNNMTLDVDGKDRLSWVALCYIYLYKHQPFINYHITNITFLTKKFNNNSIIRMIVFIPFAPLLIFGYLRNTLSNSILRLFAGIMLLLFLLVYAIPLLIISLTIATFISPERKTREKLSELIAWSRAGNIIYNRLQKIDADTGYVP